MAENSRNNGWQGRTLETPTSQHQWASGSDDPTSRAALGVPRKSNRKFIVLLLGALIATGGLVYSISYYPTKTPLVTICLKDYEWPLQPNAGVLEDQNSLAMLDGLNVSVSDLSDRWKNKQTGLQQLDSFLTQQIKQQRHRGPILIYINGHGAVDQKGEPCLLLPGYDPKIREHWLKMRSLLTRVQPQVNGSHHLVLIVDCVKSRQDWRSGMLLNTWQDRMQSLVEELGYTNLSVLSAVGSHQVNEFSNELNSTSFGHFLKLGLAGFADRDSESSYRGRSLGDGKVSLKELVAYLRTNVSRWTIRNRGDLQLPELLSNSSADVLLTTTLNAKAAREIENARQLDPATQIPLDELGLLWEKLDQLRAGKTLQFRPRLIHYFENQLVYLEDLQAAGKGYSTQSARLYQNLDIELNRSLAEADSWAAKRYSEENQGRPLGSIRSNEMIGSLSKEDVGRLKEELIQMAQSDQDVRFKIGERIGQPQPLETFVGRWLNSLNRSGVWPNNTYSSRYAQLHLKSELLGLPDDLRIHPWIQKDIEQADQTRRKAFDALFAGSTNAEAELVAAENLLEKLMSDENSSLNRTNSFFQVRDRATAMFIPWAQWQTRWRSPLSRTDESVQLSERNESRLLMVDLARTLRNYTIGLSQPTQQNASAELFEVFESLDASIQNFESSFSAYCKKLINQSVINGTLVFDLKSALRVPTISAENRKELQQKLRTAQIKLAEDEDDSKAAFGEKDWDELIDHLSGEAETQSDLATHPFIEFLNVSLDENEDTSDPVYVDRISNRLGQEIAQSSERAFLLQKARRLANRESDDFESLSPQDQFRLTSGVASFMQRQVYPMIDISKLELDLSTEFQKFEMQQALLWLADRSMLDFYGRLPGNSVGGVKTGYTFESLTSALTRQASELSPKSGFNADRIARVTNGLGELKAEAETAISLAVDSEIQVDDSADSRLKLELNSARLTTPNQNQEIEGEIAFHLGSPDNPEWGPGFSTPFPIPTDSRSKDWNVDSQLNSQLTAFFRGHLFQSTVVLKNLNGHRVVIAPRRSTESDVTLVGDRTGPSSVMFILDCSKSMGDLIRSELVGDEQVPRLTLAKGAMATMMDEIASRRDTRVGVRYFGHRSGWSTTDPSVKLRQDLYSGKFPDLLVPENDVELALPVGRFTEQEANAVKKQMESIRPWGQSPLNLSLIQAMNDFEFEEEGTQKSIVVITDGLNYQFSPNTNTLNNSRITSLEEVTRQIENRKIPIYILGFGIPAEERKEAAESFFSIANKSGGEYFEVESGRQLLLTMRNQLQLGSYRVVNERNQAVLNGDKDRTKLYDSLKLDRAGEFTLVSESAQQGFITEGGESLIFQMIDGPLIASIPYNKRQLEAGTMLHPEQSGRIVFRAHRPNRQEQSVDFFLSYQFQNQAFTPRPQDLWIEIKPTYDADQLPSIQNFSYVFFDRVFETGTPVPVVKCTVPNWPKDSKNAEIRAFCRFDSALPAQVIPLDNWNAQEGRVQESRPVEGIPGVRYQVEFAEGKTGNRLIRIVETHDANSDGIYSIRLDLKSSPRFKPDKVVRQFDVENRMGVHTYYFDSKTYDAVIGSDESSIVFTKREAIQTGAWKLREPLNVRVFAELELLPLDAATGDR